MIAVTNLLFWFVVMPVGFRLLITPSPVLSRCFGRVMPLRGDLVEQSRRLHQPGGQPSLAEIASRQHDRSAIAVCARHPILRLMGKCGRISLFRNLLSATKTLRLSSPRLTSRSRQAIEAAHAPEATSP